MRDKWFTRPVAGWLMYDFANSAFATTILAVIFSRYFAEVIAGGSKGVIWKMFGNEIKVPGAALWNFVVAISMIFVAFSSPLIGAIADRSGIRKRMLGLYCYFGVICTGFLYFVGAGDIWLASLLFIGGNIGFAGGNVFYNAFLLDIGNEKTYGRISGSAWGFGYLGGGLCLLLNLLMLQHPEMLGFDAGSFSVGDCLLVSAIWWGVFAIPTFLWIREKMVSKRAETTGESIFSAFSKVLTTLKQVRRYRQLFRFLVAYLIFNDGIETVIITAAIFGSEVVGLGTGDLVVFFILIQGTGIIGSLLFGWLADIIGNKNALLISILVWLGVVVWAFYIGWFTDMRTEFYIIGIIAGLVMGGSQSAARSLQALFTPREYAAEYFGFFSLSGKFANVFGTTIYGATIIITGSVQSAILVLGIFFLVGGAILYFVDEREGADIAQSIRT